MIVPVLALGQLKYSPDSLYLVEQNGTPVFLNGIGSWDLNNLTYAQAKRFLDTCYSTRINFLQVRAMSPALFGGPANAYGVNPWLGSQTFSSTPTPAFWAHMDSVIGYAKSRGIYVMLYPDYLGGDATQGWANETGNSSTAQMRAWGANIAGRYRDSTNVLWGIAGDINPSTWQTKLDSMVAGMKSTGDSHLMMTRDEPATTTDSHWPNRPWLTLNGMYPYWPTFDISNLISTAGSMRARRPRKPSGLQEAWYENEHGATQTQLRQQAYYTVFGGAIAYQIFGNCPNWHFSKFPGSLCGAGNWVTELTSQGMKNQKIFWQIVVRNRPWYKLIPDINHTVVTAGFNSGSTYAATAWASDSMTILCYMSTNRQVTVNTNYIKSADSVRAAWLDPATGDSTYIGTFARTGSQNFTPSGSHDWVLALDAKETPLSVGATDEGRPNKVLIQSYPNPFNSETTIRYSLPARSEIILSVVSLLGENIRVLFSGAHDPGSFEAHWDGRNDAGHPVASGAYLLRLHTRDQTLHEKIVMVK